MNWVSAADFSHLWTTDSAPIPQTEWRGAITSYFNLLWRVCSIFDINFAFWVKAILLLNSNTVTSNSSYRKITHWVLFQYLTFSLGDLTEGEWMETIHRKRQTCLLLDFLVFFFYDKTISNVYFLHNSSTSRKKHTVISVSEKYLFKVYQH